MGVVQHHGVGRVQGQHLTPPAHGGGLQPGSGSPGGQMQHIRHTQRRQGIVHAETPGQVYGIFAGGAVRRGGVKGYAQGVRLAQQPKRRQGAPICLVGDAVPHHLAAVVCQNFLAVGVVGVHDASRAAAEQHAFPRAVLGKAGVFLGRNMVGR